MSLTAPPSALLFDVFGTVVDWRSTVSRTLSDRCHSTLSSATASLPSVIRLRASTLSLADWGTFAQQWQNSYKEFTRNHDSKSNFTTVDQHHHSALKKLLEEWDLEGLWTADEVEDLSRIWHYLDPWPDSSLGLTELNKKFVTGTLSNGNVSLLADLAKYAHLPWTHIFSSEHFQAYKPKPEVYLGAAKKLGLAPEKCALVAAHLGDLKAAKGCGYKAIYVERAREEDWSAEEQAKAKEEGWVDMWVSLDEGGFLEVAKRFGIERDKSRSS